MKSVDEEVSHTLGALMVDAKGTPGAVKISDSAALSMTDRRSAVDA